MKKSFLIILFVLFISSFGNSQDKYPYFSVDVSGGGIMPIGEGMITNENFHEGAPNTIDYFGDVYTISGGFCVDLLIHLNPNWAVFCNGSYNILRTKSPYESNASNNYFVLNGGPRYYFLHEKTRVYGEVGAGLYNYYMGPYSGEYTINRSSASDTTIRINHLITTASRDLGINIGAGIELPIGNLPANFMAKAKYHFVFTNPLNEEDVSKWSVKKNTSFISFYVGINANIW